MKKYCVDTSGLSNPLETMPEDIHTSLWGNIAERIEDDQFAVTQEIYAELELLEGQTGECIRKNKDSLILEVGSSTWNWPEYVAEISRMQVDHESYISESNGNRKGTIGLADLSIVALGKALNLPVISMEANAGNSPTKKRIPDMCKIEDVEHLTFNDFLRREGIKL